MSEHHTEHRNLTRAYAGFQMATALYIVSNPSSFHFITFILPLFAVSIPSTIALGGLPRFTSEDEKRNPNPLAAVCQSLAYIPSLAAISLILWPASALAAVAFPATIAAWVFAIVRLRRRQHG